MIREGGRSDEGGCRKEEARARGARVSLMTGTEMERVTQRDRNRRRRQREGTKT